MDEAAAIWRELDEQVARHKLPERVTDLLYEAVIGYRLRRSSYVKAAGIEQRTATRDLGRLVDAGLLEARGETRGRHYVAGEALSDIRRQSRSRRRRLRDPYPALPVTVATEAASVGLPGEESGASSSSDPTHHTSR